MRIYIVYMFFSRQPVHIKIPVHADYFPYAGFFRSNNKGGICKIHWQVQRGTFAHLRSLGGGHGILFRQVDDARHIILVYIADDYPLAHHPLIKIALGADVKVQHVGYFGKNCQGAYEPVVIFFQKSDYPLMIPVA